ncbi:hypothetical protein ACEZCY_12015 [Streptacidiphilus sp. N1-12]|uniref:Uncharacterized protein n=2 Tax=Streptacidiphilus alkalitolerans TaxID=3342712 RepID=A0ABV6WD37_9ACTN
MKRGIHGRRDHSLVLGHLLLPVAVLLDRPWLFLGGTVLAVGSELRGERQPSWLRRMLRDNFLGMEVRTTFREILLLLLLVRAWPERQLPPAVVLCVSAFVLRRLLRMPSTAVMGRLWRTRKLAVETRNIDAAGLRIGRGPARELGPLAVQVNQVSGFLGITGPLLAAATGEHVLAPAGSGLMLLLAVGWCCYLAPVLLRNRRIAGREEALRHVQKWIDAYRPETMLHFAGTRTSGYQLNMWLETLARLDGRTMILLSNRHTMEELAPTSLPVVCIPVGAELMNLDWSSVKVVFYAANVGASIQTMRLPTARHVFIGHGDSDKLASVNPFSRVYDEIWTAGRAGVDRYAQAQVGVREEALVEVGRPQLGRIQHGPRGGGVRTVLYAPTWESWTEDPGNTSLGVAGEKIVAKLLASPEPLRVLYRPHPFTGLRDRRMAAVDTRIRGLIAQANAKAAAGTSAAPTAGQKAALAELAEVRAELASILGGWRGAKGDSADRTRDCRLTRAQEERVNWLHNRRGELVWSVGRPDEHRLVIGEDYALYDCFNESDALVSDISSVVSDFMASGRPYAITDAAGLGAEEFRLRNTAARAAVILTPDAGGLDALLAALRDPAADELAEQREELKSYLLGPEEPSSMTRFQMALDDLVARRARGRVPRLREPVEASALR